MIPKNIIQFWHDLDDLPATAAAAMSQTARSNPNYKLIIADDSIVEGILEKDYGSFFLELYRLNRIPASRSDIARLVLLYRYGGFYIDALIEVGGSLDKYYGAGEFELVLVKRDDMAKYSNCEESAHFINGFMASKPKSKFIKSCIEGSLENLVSGQYNNRVTSATGPILINKVLLRHGDITVRELSMKELLTGLIRKRRIPGVSNSWVCTQSTGILPPKIYGGSARRFRKLFFWGRFGIHVSLCFLMLRKSKNID